MSFTPSCPASGADPVPKVCACGISYDAHMWACLAYVGHMTDEVEALELRNCSGCGSTLAVELPTPCIVEDCPWHASWTAVETLADYCPLHVDEWLLSEASIERREAAE